MNTLDDKVLKAIVDKNKAKTYHIPYNANREFALFGEAVALAEDLVTALRQRLVGKLPIDEFYYYVRRLFMLCTRRMSDNNECQSRAKLWREAFEYVARTEKLL